MPRKSRPIPRAAGKLRDARLFIIASEDTYAPQQYFGFFSHPRIHVEVLPTIDNRSNPRAIIDRLVRYADDYQIGEEDQLWALMDTDHWISGNHQQSLSLAIKDARRRGYRIAMSRPCFDLWLLLHHDEIRSGDPITNCDSVGKRIRELTGEFNKKFLKSAHYPPQSCESAFIRAQNMELDVEKAHEDYWPDLPGTRVWLLIRELKNAGMIL